MILEDYIQQHSQQQPDKVAVVCGGRATTYAQLWSLIEERGQCLLNQGAVPGKLYVFTTTQDIDFLVTYFALHRIGAIAVPVTSDFPQQRVQQIRELGQTTIPEGVADVLFTTGTTGQSKGVMISHRTILADAENLIQSQGYSPQHLFIINGPLNHIGSLSKVYPMMMQGGTLSITNGMRDISAFFAAMDYPAEKVATFLVPTSIRILLQFGRERLQEHADKIDFIETGAAPISQNDMVELSTLLPHTRLYNTYASTETGIISTYNNNDGVCQAGCLGRPMLHSEFFITEDGCVACKGSTLMSGYLGDEAQTSKILRNGVLYTSDRGTVDTQGRLHLTGRSDDVINIGGYKVNPVEVEEVAISMPEIQDCICISVSHPVFERVLQLLVVLQDGCNIDKKAIANYLNARLESYKMPYSYKFVDKIQRTYNGKLDRKFYR